MMQAGKITRKSMIYKTEVEYGDYTINHVQGCSHGCKYPCYAMMLAKRFGKVKTYEEWCQPYIVENALEIIAKELPKCAHKITSLHLCFTTDPFMYGYPEICDMTIDIINLVNSYNVPCTALTKGILPKKLLQTSKINAYGITLISLNEEFREKIEKGSAKFMDRINALKLLHDHGYKTWVSIEPYPTPNIIKQDLLEILEKVKFVDKIIFGRLNYNKEVTKFKNHRQFFNECARQVIEFCQQNNIEYHIKEGTIRP